MNSVKVTNNVPKKNVTVVQNKTKTVAKVVSASNRSVFVKLNVISGLKGDQGDQGEPGQTIDVSNINLNGGYF